MTNLKNPFFTLTRLLLTGVFSSLAMAAVQAQDKTEQLSLEEALQAVAQHNSAIQSAQADEAIALEKFRQTNAGFLPSLNFSYTAMASDNPLNAFGFKLQQQSVTAADFNPDLLNHPGSTTDVTTKISLQQPLFNLDALYMKKGAQQQLESVRYQVQRTREQMVLETKTAYYQVRMAHQAVEVLEQALATVKAVYTFTSDRMLQGLVQQSDLLNVNVQVLGTQSSLNEAKANLLNASDYLSVLMNKPTGVVYQTTDMEPLPVLSDTLYRLPEQRADFMAIEKAMAATDWMMRSSKASYLPRLNAFGAYQYNDRKIAGFDAGSYLAGIQLSWNIFDGNLTRQKVRTLKREHDKLALQLHSMRQENQMRLDKASRDLSNASFKVKQYRAAVTHAEEALRIIQNRYKEGLVNTTDVLNAQTQLAQQKLMLVQATLGYYTSRATIEYLTSTNNNNQH